MHLLNGLVTLFALALSITARPLSVIDSYGGDLGSFFELDQNNQVTLTNSYPRWLGDEQTSAPWQSAVEQGNVPDTGIVRSYDFTITRTQLAPDGVEREMFAINGQFPGPLLEANWGDTVEVTVHNGIVDPGEPMSMHWHGLLQQDTPWADGAIGVSQCPLAPNSSFTYRFKAESYGTSFYHSHYSAQYTAGISGPIQIYGPSEQDYDIDIGPVMLSDWYHAPYTQVVENVLGTNYSNLIPTSDSGLINGRGRYDCSLVAPGTACEPDSEYAKFRFQSDKTHRLRLINSGADGIQKFAIDDHVMTVIAVDFTPVEAYETSIVTLAVGQRADVLVKGKGDPSASVWMRSQMPGGGVFCGGNDNTQAIRAAVFYESADNTIEPSSIAANNDAACVNDPLDTMRPLDPIPMATDPLQLDITFTLAVNDTGSFVWKLNDQTFDADLSNPLLFADDLKDLTATSLYNTGNVSSVRLNVTNATPFAHPFHLHGYHYQILASGPDTATSVYPATDANPLSPAPATTWNGTVEVPTDNPPRRDTHIVPALGYAVFQFNTDNPGVWPFHCHTAWHASGGMTMNLLVRPEDVVQPPAGTREATCDAWNQWQAATSYGPIDAAG